MWGIAYALLEQGFSIEQLPHIIVAVKGHTAKVVSISAAPVNKAVVVDEYGRLDAELKAVKPKEARHEQLRETIQSWYESADPEQSFTVDGSRYTVELSARANERKIKSIQALYKRFGIREFLKLVTVSLKALEERLTVAEMSAFVTQDRTGRRGLKVTEKLMAGVA